MAAINLFSTVTHVILGLDNSGATDVTSAVNAKISALNSTGGGTLYFAPGTYRFDSAILLKSNVRLYGDRTSTIFYQYGQYLFTGQNDLTEARVEDLSLSNQISGGGDAWDACFSLNTHKNCLFRRLNFAGYTNNTIIERFVSTSDTVNTIYNTYEDWNISACVAFDLAQGVEGGATVQLYYQHDGDGATTVINTGIVWPEEKAAAVSVFLESSNRRMSQMDLTTDYTISFSSSVLIVTLVSAAATGTKVHIWPSETVSTNRQTISNNRWTNIRGGNVTGVWHQWRRWVDAETYTDERFVVNADGVDGYVANFGDNRSSQAGDYNVVIGSIIGKGSGVSDVTTISAINIGPGTKSFVGVGVRVDGTWETGGVNYALEVRDGHQVNLTGVVTTNGTTAVTGSGTKFTEQLTLVGAVPDRIVIEGTVYGIASIASDTSLTLSSTAAAAAGVFAKRQNNGAGTNYDITWASKGNGNTNDESRQGVRDVLTLEENIYTPVLIKAPDTDGIGLDVRRIVNADAGIANPKAIRARTDVLADTDQTEWALSAELYNYSDTASTGNVAVSGTAKKFGAATIFAGHFNSIDTNTYDLSTGVTACVGIEVHAAGIGLDHPTSNGGNGLRISTDVKAKTPPNDDAAFDEWAATTAYALGNQIVATGTTQTAPFTTWYYECTTAGTSGGSEPTFPTTIGSTVADGTVVWTARRGNEQGVGIRIKNQEGTAGWAHFRYGLTVEDDYDGTNLNEMVAAIKVQTRGTYGMYMDQDGRSYDIYLGGDSTVGIYAAGDYTTAAFQMAADERFAFNNAANVYMTYSGGGILTFVGSGSGYSFDGKTTIATNTILESNGVTIPPIAASAIADVGDAINTANKRDGKVVWDTTNNRLMIASGSAAADPWYYAEGGTSVTPA